MYKSGSFHVITAVSSLENLFVDTSFLKSELVPNMTLPSMATLVGTSGNESDLQLPSNDRHMHSFFWPKIPLFTYCCEHGTCTYRLGQASKQSIVVIMLQVRRFG